VSSFVAHLACPRCARTYDHRELHNVCPACGSPFLVEYDIEHVAEATSREAVAARGPTMWRYRELLPVEDGRRVVSLGEGFTPMLSAPGLGETAGLPDLWIKEDGLNPTGTFKARGAAAGMTAAVERGVKEVALPTAGNAGGAWAAYGAAAGVRVHVAMPADAPEVNRLECLAYGAEVTLVDGLISDAGSVIAEGVLRYGWFDVSTLREPYRIEGKKTLGFEIAEQLGWKAPDAIVYPAGGGVGIIGIWRALEQLRRIGWIPEEPAARLIVVQADGCAPLVEAFDRGRDECEPWPDARTIAHGLRVPKPLGDFLVLRAVRESGGTAVAVSDRAILSAMTEMARGGISACPEGAATYAALHPLREAGHLRASDRVVLINTGTGLKDQSALRAAAGDGP
jgi:threonine synthase